MKTSNNSLSSLLFGMGRNFPKPIRRILLKFYVFSLKQISRIKEIDKLSDLPQMLDSSRRSLRSGVQFDPYTIAKKYQLEINSVCHVGAHKGQEISDYLRLGISSAVLIEPVHENYVVLQDITSKIPKYEAVNMAIGNHEGLVKMILASNDFQSSSILQPHLHLQEAPKVLFDRTIEIEISTLDNILTDSRSLDLIVIDVQGYELEVLKGAKRSLDRCNYIFIEVNRAETYQGCAMIKDIDEFLYDHGFQRVLTKWWSSWGDAFYIREQLLPIRTTTK